MSKIDYSIDALNVRNCFFSTDTIVYVEGDDDILFWDKVFRASTSASIYIEAVGGSKELDKYIELINSGELESIAARDSDYLDFEGKKNGDSKIIYTVGHSIENSIYCADFICRLAMLFCKKKLRQILMISGF